jgi:hypothetical protein
MRDEPKKTNWPILILWIAADCIAPAILWVGASSATLAIATLVCWLGVTYFCIRKMHWAPR